MATKSKNLAKKSDAKFAEGLGFRKVFFLFLIFSVFGAVYEEILFAVETWWDTGTPVWSLRRGVIYGPFNVIYGFGAVMMIWALARKKRKWWKTFIYAALLGGIVEYIVGWLQETFTHTRSWDYSDQILNFSGRTSVLVMLVWGVMGIVLVNVIYPWLSKWIEKIPMKVGEKLFWTLLILMILDMLVSWTALIRQTLRHNDIAPWTPVGEFYDEYYTDEFLVRYFPNMEHKDLK